MRRSHRLILLILIVLAPMTAAAKAQASIWSPSPGHVQIPIWPGPPPDASVAAAPESVDGAMAHNVSIPTMTVYSPKGANTGAAVVVFPGGGYQVLAMALEGTEICDWLTAKGIACVLLKYRVPNSGPHWEDQCQCQVEPKIPAALQDAQRTLGLVRLHAMQWGIDPNKIGVIGFSAGGYLVAWISTHFETRAYAPIDAADRESCRPDFAIALYPGHLSMAPNTLALRPTIAGAITAQSPPTFLLQNEDDHVDSIDDSIS